jgi:hypothetical protein
MNRKIIYTKTTALIVNINYVNCGKKIYISCSNKLDNSQTQNQQDSSVLHRLFRFHSTIGFCEFFRRLIRRIDVI